MVKMDAQVLFWAVIVPAVAIFIGFNILINKYNVDIIVVFTLIVSVIELASNFTVIYDMEKKPKRYFIIKRCEASYFEKKCQVFFEKGGEKIKMKSQWSHK